VETIRITVNGEEQRVPADCSLEQLMARLGVPTSGTAVELAGEIVPRARYEATRLRAGQALEIVRLVGGG
jgi:thiamine biosynthesis protein ThiS